MELPNEVLEQIERYITHQLPDDQRQGIEHRMETDPNFRQTVQDMRRTRAFIDGATRLEKATQEKLIRMARSVMTQLDSETQQNSQPTVESSVRSRSPRIALWQWAMAAMVVLIGGAYLLVSPIELANADLDPGVHRAALQAPTNDLRPAERQALDDFLMANAFYTDGNYEKAIQHYEKAANAPISAYLKEAIWYNLSLACLKAGQTQKAQHYWDLYEATLEQPHYPSSFLDRTRIRTRLIWQEIFA